MGVRTDSGNCCGAVREEDVNPYKARLDSNNNNKKKNTYIGS